MSFHEYMTSFESGIFICNSSHLTSGYEQTMKIGKTYEGTEDIVMRMTQSLDIIASNIQTTRIRVHG